MKGLKKIALATAVAAAPFAQAEMTAMDDALLGEMTGQAGVSIELDTQVKIGSMTWTDNDGVDGGTEGKLSINNIVFGGATVAGSAYAGHNDRFDDIKIDIDVDGDDGLIIHLAGTSNLTALNGSNPVDFGLSVESVRTGSVVNDIASDIKIFGNLGPVDITIDGDGTLAANDLIKVDAFFEVTQGSLDVDVIGLGIRNLKVGQDSKPLLATTSAYNHDLRQGMVIGGGGLFADVAAVDAFITSKEDGAVTANALLITGAGTAAADAVAQAAGFADDVALQADATPANDAARTLANTKRAGTEAAVTAQIRETAQRETIAGAFEGLDTSTGLYSVSAEQRANNAVNMAYVSMSISTANTGYFDIDTAQAIAVTNALEINLDSFNIDVSMDLHMGGSSIGNIALDDLDLSGTNLKIYGH